MADSSDKDEGFLEPRTVNPVCVVCDAFGVSATGYIAWDFYCPHPCLNVTAVSATPLQIRSNIVAFITGVAICVAAVGIGIIVIVTRAVDAPGDLPSDPAARALELHR
eukprot:gene4588-4802_t